MTLPAAGSLSVSMINGEFGLGYALTNYIGTRWYTDAGATGTFVSPLGFDQFYAKRYNSPYAGGTQNFTTPGTYQFIIPGYAAMTIAIRGGGGGGGGAYGNNACVGGATTGSAGSSGGASSFGAYGSATGGGGGGATNGNSGTAGGPQNDGNPVGGGAGGAGNNSAGGAGGLNIITLTNPAYGGDGPSIGTTITVIVGAGGPGGAGGENYGIIYLNAFFCVSVGAAASGGTGGGGSVAIAWS